MLHELIEALSLGRDLNPSHTVSVFLPLNINLLKGCLAILVSL